MKPWKSDWKPPPIKSNGPLPEPIPLTDKERKVLWAVLMGALTYSTAGSMLGDELVATECGSLLAQSLIRHIGSQSVVYEITDRGRAWL